MHGENVDEMSEQLRLLYLQLRYNALLVFIVLGIASWGLEQIASDLWLTRGGWGLLWAAVIPLGLVLLFRLTVWAWGWLFGKPAPPMGKTPTPRRAMIILYGREAVVKIALQAHRASLDLVWFIVTAETQAEYAQLPNHWWGKAVGTLELVHDHYLPDETRNAVERAISHAAVHGIAPADLICDLTGGTKAMTIGAFAACMEYGVAVQMTPALYDQARKPSSIALPIELQITTKPLS